MEQIAVRQINGISLRSHKERRNLTSIPYACQQAESTESHPQPDISV
ncbi:MULTISPECIES: hypothetical protein [Bacteroides]|jgi:hypothetical protein|nr:MULTISPECIES: hypothetical protein [Bacteroides]MCB6270564.1 hypothetical protein [Bacteroides cellulosilyticus]MCG4971220.1 hypothetical protein [Bacteroides cellulosilyticus]